MKEDERKPPRTSCLEIELVNSTDSSVIECARPFLKLSTLSPPSGGKIWGRHSMIMRALSTTSR